MKYVKFGTTNEKVPAIVLGCMRLSSLSVLEAAEYIEQAVSKGVNFFDHADIYSAGQCEEIFGMAFQQTDLKREDVFIQSKCGIVSKLRYDFSKEHILSSVDGSLKRLGVDYLDALLLHRPDALVEPEEVAEVFDILHTSGKVRYFGVSNHKPMQIELLKKYVKQPLVANQMQLSAAHASMISNGIEANMLTTGAVDRDGSVLDYCRVNDITIQAWSPFQYGKIAGVFLKNKEFAVLNDKLAEIGENYDVSATTMAVAWLLRHPANMQVLAGTMNFSRLEEICKACNIQMTRQEWYDIFRAAGNILP